MRSIKYTSVVAATLALAAQSASAQTALEIEGKILGLSSDGAGGAIVRVMGRDIAVPYGTPIATPTTSLNVDQLLDPTLLPGRSEPGFLGGTAIIIGTTGPTGAVAEDVFVEPSENVVLGRFSGPMQIEGMPVELIEDARMPALPITNAFGFAVDPGSILAETPAAMEGYYGDDYTFHAFLIEAEGGTVVNAGVQEVSVLRAQCRQRTNGTIELQVSGGTHDPAAGPVTFQNTGGTRTYGTINATPDPVDPQFGSYVFSVRSSGLGLCPQEIVAAFGTARTIGTVAVRID